MIQLNAIDIESNVQGIKAKCYIIAMLEKFYYLYDKPMSKEDITKLLNQYNITKEQYDMMDWSEPETLESPRERLNASIHFLAAFCEDHGYGENTIKKAEWVCPQNIKELNNLYNKLDSSFIETWKTPNKPCLNQEWIDFSNETIFPIQKQYMDILKKVNKRRGDNGIS